MTEAPARQDPADGGSDVRTMPADALTEVSGLPWSGLSATEAYQILKLRSLVFVVEQDCVFLDADGIDLHPETEHYVLRGVDGPRAYLRLLPRGAQDGPASSPEGRSVGRVVTDPEFRGLGLAGRLVDAVVARHGSGLLTLNAQKRLEPWYGRWGFETSGPDFLEDDILHTPMRRTPTPSR